MPTECGEVTVGVQQLYFKMPWDREWRLIGTLEEPLQWYRERWVDVPRSDLDDALCRLWRRQAAFDLEEAERRMYVLMAQWDFSPPVEDACDAATFENFLERSAAILEEHRRRHE